MRAFVSVLTGALLLLAGCGDSPTEPSPADVVGSYAATTLTVDDGDSTIDALAEGASLTITLGSDGTTTGTFVVPASLSESGEEEQADLEGTWTLDGSSVRFDQQADTFLRDIALQVTDGALEGEEDFGSEAVRVVLERS